MIYIGADHRGFELKERLIDWLEENGYESEDCGAFEYDKNDDYPNFAKIVAQKVSSDEKSKGIVICATGAGVDIVANRISNIRCGLGFNKEQIRKSREDDDINILALPASYLNEGEAEKIVKAFLNTAYQPTENHQRRIEKIENLR